MKRAPWDFRFRFWIFAAIYFLGFLTPWNWALHLDGRGPNAHTWGLLAVNLAKSTGIAIDGAFNLVLAIGIVFALAGALLRTWGSAYLGADVMQDRQLQGDAVVADGPYRHLRNPLYLGTMCNTVALAMLLPLTGAVFAIVAVALLTVRLITLEESFLSERLGAAYAEYCRRVPRILPVLRPQVPAKGSRGRWLEALLAEIYQWGVAGSYAAVGWKYNAGLLVQCVLVSLGVSMVVRAFPLRARKV